MCFRSSRVFGTHLGDIGYLGGDEDNSHADASIGAPTKTNTIRSISGMDNGSADTETPTERL